MTHEEFFEYKDKILSKKLEIPKEYLVKNYPDNYLEYLKYRLAVKEE